jgi:hypothetical protein
VKAEFQATSTVKIEVEGESPAELFENISNAQEAFMHECCGFCKNANIKFLVRTDEEENKYYEMKCTNLSCNAKLPFGQNKKPKGGLYPKRRWSTLSEKEKEHRGPEPKNGFMPNNGWYKYVANNTNKPQEKKS